MRGLIFAHRHEVGFVHDDVRGLKHRVAEERVVADVFLADVLALFFVGRHAFEPAQRRDRRQYQVKLRVLGYQ